MNNAAGHVTVAAAAAAAAAAAVAGCSFPSSMYNSLYE